MTEKSKIALQEGIAESYRQLREAVYRHMRGWTLAEKETAQVVINAITPSLSLLTGRDCETLLAQCVKRLVKDGRL